MCVLLIDCRKAEELGIHYGNKSTGSDVPADIWTAISDFAGLDEVAMVPEPITFEQYVIRRRSSGSIWRTTATGPCVLCAQVTDASAWGYSCWKDGAGVLTATHVVNAIPQPGA